MRMLDDRARCQLDGPRPQPTTKHRGIDPTDAVLFLTLGSRSPCESVGPRAGPAAPQEVEPHDAATSSWSSSSTGTVTVFVRLPTENVSVPPVDVYSAPAVAVPSLVS